MLTNHETTLTAGLREMQGAMNNAEKLKAAHLRRNALEAAADFFLFVRDPDGPTRVKG